MDWDNAGNWYIKGKKTELKIEMKIKECSGERREAQSMVNDYVCSTVASIIIFICRV